MTEKELLQELTKILTYKDKYSDKVISLYDLSQVIKKTNTYYKKMITNPSEITIQDKHKNTNFHLESINYENNEIILSSEYGNLHQISCKIVDGKISLTVLNNPTHSSTIPKFNAEEISTLYDKIIKFSEYTKEEYYGVHLSNYPSFLVNITKEGITIYKEGKHAKEFILSSYVFKKDYILTTNSKLILELLPQNKDILLQNLFIKIDKCPKWSQEKLHEIRQHQIEENLPHKVKKLKK